MDRIVSFFRMLRVELCPQLHLLAAAAAGAEQDALLRRFAAVLRPVVTLVQQRLEINTLLPGTVREEELDFDARVQAMNANLRSVPVPNEVDLRRMASVFGYKLLLRVATRCIGMLEVGVRDLVAAADVTHMRLSSCVR